MGKLIKYEIEKIITSRKNRILLLILIVFILLVNVLNNIKYNGYIDEIEQEGKISYNSAQIRRDRINIDIARLKIEDELDKIILIKDYGCLEEAEKQRPILEKQKERNDKESSLVNILLKTEKSLETMQKKIRKGKSIEGEEKLIKQILGYKIERTDNILEAEEEGILPESALKLGKVTINDIRRKNTYYKYIAANNLKYTINPYTNSGVFGIMGLFENTIMLLMFLIFTFISMDIFLSEIEEGSYKLLYTQPYKRSKIFFSKVVAAFIFITVVIIVLCGLNYAINTLLSGPGNFSEPVAVSENIRRILLSKNTMNFEIISIGINILLNIILFLVVLIFIISLISALSVFTDSTTKTMGIVIALILLCILLRKFVSPDSMIHGILPFSYIFSQDVLIEKYNTSYIFGVLLNLGLSAVLLLISSRKIEKKDFLGLRA